MSLGSSNFISLYETWLRNLYESVFPLFIVNINYSYVVTHSWFFENLVYVTKGLHYK